MIQVIGGNNPKINIAGDSETLELEKNDPAERVRISLRLVRQIHKIKASSLGESYRSLGDIAWQILCDIYLHNIEGRTCTLSDLGPALDLRPSQLTRYVAILESDHLIVAAQGDGCSDTRNLCLTELGRKKVGAALGKCSDVLAGSLI